MRNVSSTLDRFRSLPISDCYRQTSHRCAVTIAQVWYDDVSVVAGAVEWCCVGRRRDIALKTVRRCAETKHQQY